MWQRSERRFPVFLYCLLRVVRDPSKVRVIVLVQGFERAPGAFVTSGKIPE